MKKWLRVLFLGILFLITGKVSNAKSNFNFQNASITDVIAAFQKLTQSKVVVDSMVRGQVNIISNQEDVTSENALRLLI